MVECFLCGLQCIKLSIQYLLCSMLSITGTKGPYTVTEVWPLFIPDIEIQIYNTINFMELNIEKDPSHDLCFEFLFQHIKSHCNF